jgi:uncharacterized protein YbjT (DUF2867 family)
MAEASEQVLMDSGADWTVLRSGWFCRNLGETYLLDPRDGDGGDGHR